jgi:hypothetical protein
VHFCGVVLFPYAVRNPVYTRFFLFSIETPD